MQRLLEFQKLQLNAQTEPELDRKEKTCLETALC